MAIEMSMADTDKVFAAGFWSKALTYSMDNYSPFSQKALEFLLGFVGLNT